jgi:hypothetical protein
MEPNVLFKLGWTLANSEFRIGLRVREIPIVVKVIPVAFLHKKKFGLKIKSLVITQQPT